MTRARAHEVLGTWEGQAMGEIRAVYEGQRQALREKMESGPQVNSLLAKYQQELDVLREAYEVLTAEGGGEENVPLTEPGDVVVERHKVAPPIQVRPPLPVGAEPVRGGGGGGWPWWGTVVLAGGVLVVIAVGVWWFGYEKPRVEREVAGWLVRAGEQIAGRQWSEARRSYLEVQRLAGKNAEAAAGLAKIEDMITRPRGVVVVAQPAGAKARLGQGEAKEVPARFEDVGLGQHTVTVEREGYEAASRTVQVGEAGQEVKVEGVVLELSPVVSRLPTGEPSPCFGKLLMGAKRA